MNRIQSKLPEVGTTIFTIMSSLAKEYNAINLSQGFPDFDCPQQLKTLAAKYIREGNNQYAPMTGVPILRERIAEKIHQLYDCQIDPSEEVTITLGATEALYSSIGALVNPRDEVILIEPAYDSYRPAIKLNGGIPIIYELSAPDYRIDWTEFEQLITPKTRMIIINTPQNPIGKTFKKVDMLSLARIVKGTNILILSDEVYEHLVYDGAIHESVLRYPTLYERSLVTFSFGKTFHATGWRVGYVIGPNYLMKEVRKVHQFNTFSIQTPFQYAIADLLRKPASYLGLADFFEKKRNFLLSALQNSRLKPLHCEGSYFQLFDYKAISDLGDAEFTKWLTTEVGVAAIPISAFYTSRKDEKIIRLCFAKQKETLKKAADLLREL